VVDTHHRTPLADNIVEGVPHPQAGNHHRVPEDVGNRHRVPVDIPGDLRGRGRVPVA
jgi:hypothetical protein